ncbi:MAG: hypothetical protein ABJD51_21395 [Roseobacter sp.]
MIKVRKSVRFRRRRKRAFVGDGASSCKIEPNPYFRHAEMLPVHWISPWRRAGMLYYDIGLQL